MSSIKMNGSSDEMIKPPLRLAYFLFSWLKYFVKSSLNDINF